MPVFRTVFFMKTTGRAGRAEPAPPRRPARLLHLCAGAPIDTRERCLVRLVYGKKADAFPQLLAFLHSRRTTTSRGIRYSHRFEYLNVHRIPFVHVPPRH